MPRLPFCANRVSDLLHMSGIAKRRGCGSNVQAAQAFGISHALFSQCIGNTARNKGVSDGKSRESMDFVEGAKDKHVRAVTNERNSRPVFKTWNVLQIRLIYDHRRMMRDLAQKALENIIVTDDARRIVRIDQIKSARLRSEPGGERRQVVAVCLIERNWNTDAAYTRGSVHQRQIARGGIDELASRASQTAQVKSESTKYFA